MSNPERAAAVKQTFEIAWDGYYQYALGNDTLRPISRTSDNGLNGWGASIVDALSTSLIMGDERIIKQIVDYIPEIDYDTPKTPPDVTISLFETTIRHLGGLLSAHDLLTGPLMKLAPGDSEDKVSAILKQAVHLADLLKVGFDTPSGVPINDLYFGPPRPSNETQNGLATVGTLVLEWTRLSDITGIKEYGELAQKGESYLLNPQPPLGEPFPGLLGTNIDVRNGSFLDSSGGWNGGTDSFYEYLMKMYVYDTRRFAHYKDRWIAAADSSIKYLASHPTTRPDITFLAAYKGRDNLSFVLTHLACFDGGSFILGGLTLDRQDYIDFGLELVKGCHNTYVSTATGIGPEVFRWQDDKVPLNATNNGGPPVNQSMFYDKAGFWIPTNGDDYVLRPEVIESFYYAWRATGDPMYQEWAWDAYLAINRTTRVGAGYSDIDHVNVPGGGGFSNDNQESFFFAEVLKYSYMIHAEEAPWQVSATHDNQFVFNTEAHPVKVAGTPI